MNYLAHWVSKQGVQPSDANLRAITECALPQTYTGDFHAFLGLIGHYQAIHKGLCMDCLAIEQITWLGREPVESWNGCHCQRMPWEAFQALKQACMSTPILAFADYTKDFLLETDMLVRRDWEWYCLKKKQTGNTTWLPTAAGPSLPMKRTIILPNLSSCCWNGPSWNISRNTCCTNPS